MANETLTCVYCGAANAAGASRCKACGAPIELPVRPPVKVTQVADSNRSGFDTRPPQVTRSETTSAQVNDALEAAPISEQLKDGLKAVGAGAGLLGVGAIIARTGAEAASIALSSFLIGFFAGGTGSVLIAVGGGLLVGLAVGLVVKRWLAVMFSGPFGTVLGLAAGTFLRPALPDLPLQPLLGTAGGMLFAFLGGRRGSTGGITSWYTRLRPFLGALGGILFGLLGYLVGSIAR